MMAKTPAPDAGEVTQAVDRDLARLAKRSPEVADSALAASARALARELDSQTSATSKSMCARALLETLDRLRELAPAEHKVDRLDELATRRTARLARGAAS
jgi:uncharacterized tellurite resistance protein B-like protein